MDVDATPHKIPISHTENRVPHHFGIRCGFGVILDFNLLHVNSILSTVLSKIFFRVELPRVEKLFLFLRSFYDF